MKSNQASFLKHAVLAGLIAGGGILAATAYGVPPDEAGAAPRCMAHPQGEGGWEARRAAHLAALKDKLKLTAQQETAWKTFTEASQPGPRPGMGRGAMQGEFEKLSTPERLDRMQAMAEMRRAHMAERAEAIKAFYAQLTPEQQKVFDAEGLPRHRGHHQRDRF